jgi:hypothetical protein
LLSTNHKLLTLSYRCSEENVGGEDEYWSDYEEF